MRLVPKGCQVLLQKNLTRSLSVCDPICMRTGTKTNLQPRPQSIAAVVHRRIQQGGDRLWRVESFGDLPFMAVAQALSRLARHGTLERVTKGVYFRPKQTAFGKSRPNPARVQRLAARRKSVFPSGATAANLLGFTTQNPARGEVSTTSLSLPRKLIGNDVTVHARRPEAWSGLSEVDAALLDFLRRRGETSDLSPEETVARLIKLISANGRFERLVRVADSEPPRVRAMLGALGEQAGKGLKVLERLRRNLNPLSKFDFGVLAALPHARRWQAKEPR